MRVSEKEGYLNPKGIRFPSTFCCPTQAMTWAQGIMAPPHCNPAPLPCTSALHICSAPLPYTSALYLFPTPLPCTCALHLCPTPLPCTSALHLCHAPIHRPHL